MSEPAVTLIIPVYQAEKTLPRCLDSILNQHYTNWECICINDGSTDGSNIICNEYACKDPRFRIFNKNNGGVSSARNIGLENARGEWITFIDADDAIEIDYLSVLNDNPQQDLIIVSYKRTDSLPVPKPQDGIYTDLVIKRFFEVNLELHQLRTPWAKFFRKKLINTLRFDKSLHLGEDTLFVQQYYSHCKSILVDNSKEYLYTPSDSKLKYSPNIDYVIHTFTLLERAYTNLGINCEPYNNFLYFWFLSLIEESKIYRRKWYSNNQVRKFYMNKLANTLRKRLSYYKQWIKSYF